MITGCSAGWIQVPWWLLHSLYTTGGLFDFSPNQCTDLCSAFVPEPRRMGLQASIQQNVILGMWLGRYNCAWLIYRIFRDMYIKKRSTPTRWLRACILISLPNPLHSRRNLFQIRPPAFSFSHSLSLFLFKFSTKIIPPPHLHSLQ